jgi:type I restriction enzyme M protein
MIDARKMGTPISSTQIEFSIDEIERIGNTFESWANGNYEDVDWYCKSVTRDEIKQKGNVLSPGRYIGTEALIGDEPRPLKESLPSLSATINEQLATSASLGQQIQEVLRKLSNGL